MNTPFTIAPASIDDAPLVLEFIRELAEYEKLLHEVEADEDTVRENMFAPDAPTRVLIARAGGFPAGFAVYFYNFSTFAGCKGLYLEDLFVRPRYRGHGIGRGLMMECVRIARETGCGRMDWAVLDWNKPSIAFYESLGAVVRPDWRICRLDTKALDDLASGSMKKPPAAFEI